MVRDSLFSALRLIVKVPSLNCWVKELKTENQVNKTDIKYVSQQTLFKKQHSNLLQTDKCVEEIFTEECILMFGFNYISRKDL